MVLCFAKEVRKTKMISHLLKLREIDGNTPTLLKGITRKSSVQIIPYSALFPSLGPIESVVLLGFTRNDADGEDCLLSINQTAIEVHKFWYSSVAMRLNLTLKLGILMSFMFTVGCYFIEDTTTY